MANAQFYYFDPKNGTSSWFPKNLLENWHKFYRQIAPENKEVVFSQYTIPFTEQKDCYNCGVFVVLFMERLIRGNWDLQANLNAEDLVNKRTEMYNTLMHFSIK